MRTIRKYVFETNSSSMHCITFCNEDLGADGKLVERTTDEYPVPNEDGVLEIEVTRYWECSDLCITSNLRDIIEYFCVLADGSGYDHKGALELLRNQYEAAGLTPPKDFYLYVVDMDGNRISYEMGNFVAPEYRYLYEERRYEYMFDVWCGTNQDVIYFINNELGVKVTPAIYASTELTVEQFLKLRAAFPDFRQDDTQLPLGELAVITHGAGVACNDLTGDNLADALYCLDSDEIGQFGDRYQYYDLFKYRLTLNFWHS